MTNNIFLSVGLQATDAQEKFIQAIESRLKAEGLNACAVGRNTFGAGNPLQTIVDLMDSCDGVVVIALERSYFPSGVDRPGGPSEATLTDVRLPTPWNQIEAGMAYTRKLPLLVIVEAGLKPEGLLDRGYDWYVQRVPLRPDALNTAEFNGIFSDWKSKVVAYRKNKEKDNTQALVASLSDLTLRDLLGGLRLTQIAAALGGIITIAGAAFTLGAKLGPLFIK